MPSMTKTQYTEASTRISTRIARLVTELVQLETKWIWAGGAIKPPANKPAPGNVAATRRRGRPSRAATTAAKSNGQGGKSLGDRILSAVTTAGRMGITLDGLYAACPNDRKNHVGIAKQRHLRGKRIVERGGRFYVATTTSAVGRQQSKSTSTQPTA